MHVGAGLWLASIARVNGSNACGVVRQEEVLGNLTSLSTAPEADGSVGIQTGNKLGVHVETNSEDMRVACWRICDAVNLVEGGIVERGAQGRREGEGHQYVQRACVQQPHNAVGAATHNV